MTASVTRRILEAWKDGVVSSFSVMANGEDTEGVTVGIGENSGLESRISAHLTLTEGYAIAPKEEVKLLTDEEGVLKCGFMGLLKTWKFAGKKKRNEIVGQVETEWRSQIEKIAALCGERKIDAVDGHIHIHMLPFLFDVAARLAKEYGIPEIRVSQEPFFISSRMKDNLSPAFAVNMIKHFLLNHYAKNARKIMREYGLSGPDLLVGVLFTGRMDRWNGHAGIKAAAKRGAGTVEVLYHIGRATEDEAVRWVKNPAHGEFPLSELRDVEYEELIELKKEVERAGIGTA